MGETSWTFLLVGSFAAVGAALAAGTLMALLRYHRTGTFPGQDAGTEVTSGRLAVLWGRVVVGVALTIVGLVALQRAGVL